MKNPKSIVVMSLLASGFLISSSQLVHGKMPTYRQFIGVFVVYLFLSVGVEFTPELASLLALLVLIVVFLETFGNLAPGIDAFFSGKQLRKKTVS